MLRSIRRYLSCLRMSEILMLQGTPILGAVFALRNPGFDHVFPFVSLIAANLLLMAHVFLLNDRAGLTGDLADPNRVRGVFLARGVSRREIDWMSAILLVASLALLATQGSDPLRIGAAIALLSGLYSLPRFNWKGSPLLNTGTHLGGGILHFLLGYSIFHAVDGRSLVLASFFAVTFAAGHLTQEVRDYEADRGSGIRTNAVAFGARQTFLTGLTLFTLAYGLLIAMALGGILPRAVTALALLYPAHLAFSLRTLARGLSHLNVSNLQRRYRFLYAIIGAVLLMVPFAG